MRVNKVYTERKHMDVHKLKVLFKNMKLLLINVLVFTLTIVFLMCTNIDPEKIWPEALGFYSMELGFLVGKEHKSS